MKRIRCCFLLLISFFCVSFCLSFSTAVNATAEEKADYGLILDGAVLLDMQLEPLCTLPVTYYVVITAETPTQYMVEYADLYGFIAKSSITPVDYEPKYKFAAPTFTADNDTHDVVVRANPERNGREVERISDGASAIYYGTVVGEELVTGAGREWLYVIKGNEHGYVYAAQGIIESITANSGEKIVPANLSPQDDLPASAGLPDYVYILLLCVPAVLIVLTLFGRAKSPSRHS